MYLLLRMSDMELFYLICTFVQNVEYWQKMAAGGGSECSNKKEYDKVQLFYAN
jgi:hypothetical protein